MPVPRILGTRLCPLRLSHLPPQLHRDHCSLHPQGASDLLGPKVVKGSQPFAPPAFSPLLPPPPASPLANAPRSLGLALPESRRGPEAEAGARKEGGAKPGGRGRVFASPAPRVRARWRRRLSLALRDRYRLGAML